MKCLRKKLMLWLYVTKISSPSCTSATAKFEVYSLHPLRLFMSRKIQAVALINFSYLETYLYLVNTFLLYSLSRLSVSSFPLPFLLFPWASHVRRVWFHQPFTSIQHILFSRTFIHYIFFFWDVVLNTSERCYFRNFY